MESQLLQCPTEDLKEKRPKLLKELTAKRCTFMTKRCKNVGVTIPGKWSFILKSSVFIWKLVVFVKSGGFQMKTIMKIKLKIKVKTKLKTKCKPNWKSKWKPNWKSKWKLQKLPVFIWKTAMVFIWKLLIFKSIKNINIYTHNQESQTHTYTTYTYVHHINIHAPHARVYHVHYRTHICTTKS